MTMVVDRLFVMFRNRRYEQEIGGLLWRVNINDIHCTTRQFVGSKVGYIAPTNHVVSHYDAIGIDIYIYITMTPT